MGFRDLIPWSKNPDMVQRREEQNPFLTLQREMNRLFDDVFSGFGLSSRSPMLMEGRFSWPRVELAESDNALKVTAELPGLEEKDFHVEVHGKVLSLRGEKRNERSGESEGRAWTERTYGEFRRVVELPTEVDAEKTSAAFKNGVLSVTLPKTAAAKVRNVPVTSA